MCLGGPGLPVLVMSASAAGFPPDRRPGQLALGFGFGLGFRPPNAPVAAAMEGGRAGAGPEAERGAGRSGELPAGEGAGESGGW